MCCGMMAAHSSDCKLKKKGVKGKNIKLVEIIYEFDFELKKKKKKTNFYIFRKLYQYLVQHIQILNYTV